MKKNIFIFFSFLILTLLFSCQSSGQLTSGISGSIVMEASETGLEIEAELPFELKKETVEETQAPKESEETIDEETITEPEKEEEIEEKEEEVVVENNFGQIDFSNILSAFNYSYGYSFMSEVIDENISLDGEYFARGVYDATLSPIPSLLNVNDINSAINAYIIDYYEKGISFLPGNKPGGFYSLSSLSIPSNTEEAFSYGYTFNQIRRLIDGEVKIEAGSFIQGAFDALYETTPLLNYNERENTINEYLNLINQEYQNELESKSLSNKEKAEAFFAKNGERDEVITLENRIQYEILGEDEVLGPKPAQFDSVIADYNMYVMDYEDEELEIIDADYNSELRLMEIDSAISNSIIALHVGQAGRFWIPPEMLYGERNIEGIEPNSIVVYDIALQSIL